MRVPGGAPAIRAGEERARPLRRARSRLGTSPNDAVGSLRPVIDLHTHSTVSDGSDPPERIPELAAAAGCSAVALTDHDRLDGLEAAGRRAADLGVTLVPGCEISC